MPLLRHLPRLILALAIMTLAACGFHNGPDKDAVRQILQDQIDPSGQVVVVQSIDALNAAEQAPNWIVDVKATLLFKKNVQQLAQSLEHAASGSDMLGTVGQIGLALRFGNFKAGETQPYQTRLVLLHGSAGWMPAPAR